MGNIKKIMSKQNLEILHRKITRMTDATAEKEREMPFER